VHEDAGDEDARPPEPGVAVHRHLPPGVEVAAREAHAGCHVGKARRHEVRPAHEVHGDAPGLEAARPVGEALATVAAVTAAGARPDEALAAERVLARLLRVHHARDTATRQVLCEAELVHGALGRPAHGKDVVADPCGRGEPWLGSARDAQARGVQNVARA